MTTKKPGSSRSSTANGFIDMFLDGLQRAEVIGLLLVLALGGGAFAWYTVQPETSAVPQLAAGNAGTTAATIH